MVASDIVLYYVPVMPENCASAMVCRKLQVLMWHLSCGTFTTPAFKLRFSRGVLSSLCLQLEERLSNTSLKALSHTAIETALYFNLPS